MTTALETAHILGACFAIGAAAGCAYLLFAAVLVRRYPHPVPSGGTDLPAVTILKPLHGDEPGLLDRLLSFCDQRYDGRLQIVFGVHDRYDPAVATARRVAALRPDCDIDVIVDERLYGGNRKICNLIHCLEQARHDVLLIADSDIVVEPDHVGRVIESLTPPEVGLVTCLYIGEGNARGARLSSLAIDVHFLPNVLVGMKVGAATPCFGSTIALRRDTLERIGSLHAFVDRLADDYAIGAAVRALGLTVAVPGFVVRHGCDESTFAAFFAHQLRVARTIRKIDPRGHAGSFITNPLPLAIAATAFFGVSALLLVVAALGARLLLLQAVTRRFGADSRGIWLLATCDMVIFFIHIASFCGSSVKWRGRRLYASSDGTLAPEKGSISA